MDINWTYWDLTEDKSTGLKNVLGVCEVRGHTVQCDVYNYPDEATLKAETEKVVQWALDNEERVKRHILERHYFDILYSFCLYSSEVQSKVESANELRALVVSGEDIGIKPFASKENMERHLQLYDLTRNYEVEGFSLSFTSVEDELDNSLGGHGPLVGIRGDFSVSEEFEWSG